MYKSREHYSKDQLDAFYLADLWIDYRCALRDGMSAYAEKVRLQIEQRLPAGTTFEDAWTAFGQ